MRFIKLGIISFFVIGAIIMAIAAFIPSQVTVMRSVDLKVSKEIAKENITNFQDWSQWNAFIDSSLLNNITYTANGIQSDQLKVEKVEWKNDTLLTIWTHNNGKPIESGFVFYGEDDQKYAVLQWYFHIKVGWKPCEKFGSAVYDKQI